MTTHDWYRISYIAIGAAAICLSVISLVYHFFFAGKKTVHARQQRRYERIGAGFSAIFFSGLLLHHAASWLSVTMFISFLFAGIGFMIYAGGK